MFGKKETKSDLEIFTVHDSKAGFYGQPIFARNHLELIRDFTNDFKNPDAVKSKLFLNAEDFTLFKIGTYDRDQGLITPLSPQHIINFIDLRTMVNQERPHRDVSEPIDLGIVRT